MQSCRLFKIGLALKEEKSGCQKEIVSMLPKIMEAYLSLFVSLSQGRVNTL
jgi:hypothetical protein